MEWLGYNAWQSGLTNRGLYWQALTILSLTENLLLPEFVTVGFEDIFKRCHLGNDISSSLVALTATVSSSRHYTACCNFTKGRELFHKAEILSRGLPARDDILTGTNLDLDLELASMESHPNQNVLERAHQYAQLARKARDMHNFGRADSCFTTASELALQAFAWTEFSEWRKEIETLQAETMHDLPSLLIGRSRHWRFGGGKDLATLIEWYDNFDQANASSVFGSQSETVCSIAMFDIPIALHTKETAKRMIFGRLGDEKSLQRREQSEALLQVLQEQLPDYSIASNVEPYLRDFSNIDARDPYAALKVLINRVTVAMSKDGIDPSLAAHLLALPDVSPENLQNFTPKSLHDSFFSNSVKPRWSERLSSIKTWLEHDPSAVETGAGSYLLVRLQQLRTNNALQVDEVEKENQVFLDLISSCREDVRKSFRRNELHSRSTIALCKLEKARIKNNLAQASDYDEILQIYNDCLDSYQEPSLSRQLGDIGLLYVRMADTCQRKRRLFNIPAIEEIEEHLSNAEAVFDELRQDLSALKNSSSLIGKTGFSSAVLGAAQLRDVAYRVYRRELLVTPHDTVVQVKLWNWVQKSKGRALTDSMGLSARIPAELLHGIHADNKLDQKLAEWNAVNLELKEALQSSPSSDNASNIYYLRMHRKEVRQEMLTLDHLADIISLLEGRAIQYDEVGDLLAMAQKMDGENNSSIDLVDWFYVTDIWGNRQLYSFVVRGSEGAESTPQLNLFLLGAAEPPVKNWITKNLQKIETESVTGQDSLVPTMPSSSTAFTDLQNLKGLIQPLKAATQPGDTLILCPTESLHRLPLHALQLINPNNENQLLLARNPVLYCHSLSIFRFCVFSRLESLEPTPSKPQIAPGFFPLNLKLLSHIDDDKLKRKVRKALRTQIIEEEAVTQACFYENIEQAKCVFFLGHVHDAGSTPLESHLVLYENQPQKKCQHLEREVIRASGILENAHLSRGAHVILISCASGLSYSASADEFLDLVPAFIYSGARSTVSTLWPINQLHGVEFSDLYFDNWIRRRKGSGVADLAKCMQAAVLEMMNEYGEADLASWAAFVFHGYWMHSYGMIKGPGGLYNEALGA
jgi:CHAT domain-containing protein